MSSPEDLALTYQAGVEPKARSQWAYARIRFFRHRLAVVSLFVLIGIGLVAIFAKQVAPYGFDEQDFAISAPASASVSPRRSPASTCSARTCWAAIT